jgi:hypothetical protein
MRGDASKLAYMSDPRSRKEEHHQKNEWEVPRMHCMGGRCKGGCDDASWCKGLLRVGSVTEKQNRGARNEWMHCELRMKRVVRIKKVSA